MRKLSSRQIGVLALLLVGVGVCCLLYPRSGELNRGIPREPWRFEDDAWAERILLGLAAAVSLIPVTRRWILLGLDAIRTPSFRARRWTAAAIFLLSQPLLYFLAAVRGRTLLPFWHDENFYRLQTTFLAHGKLFGPALALPDFFDVPYVFVKPVYAVAYFPGTALLHVPALWVHLPYFVTPLLIAGVILATLYLMVTDLIDGVSGWLAVVLMMSLAVFRWMALIEMSHAACAMWGLVGIWSWLSWRRSREWRWIALAALAAGWCAITRPLDCLLIFLPVAIAWTADLKSIAPRKRSTVVAIVCIIVAPFLALQLHFDREITGHRLQTPMGIYYRTYLNIHGVGLEHFDPEFVPPTNSAILLRTYGGIVVPRVMKFSTVHEAAKQWVVDRLPVCLGTAVPSLLLLVLIPVALTAMRARTSRVVLGIFICFTVGTGLVFQFLDHYVMVIAPAVIMLILIGADRLADAFPGKRLAGAFVPTAIFLLAAHRLVLNDQGAYQHLGPGVMRSNDVDIPAAVKRPALVLFRQNPAEREGSFDDEPVYNWDVLSPDKAPIIRAHDLGPKRDRQLLAYYRRLKPDLHIYRFDRATLKLEDLGSLETAESKLAEESR